MSPVVIVCSGCRTVCCWLSSMWKTYENLRYITQNILIIIIIIIIYVFLYCCRSWLQSRLNAGARECIVILGDGKRQTHTHTHYFDDHFPCLPTLVSGPERSARKTFQVTGVVYLQAWCPTSSQNTKDASCWVSVLKSFKFSEQLVVVTTSSDGVYPMFSMKTEVMWLVWRWWYVYNSQDLVIDAIYADIIRGKLDQKHQQLEVDFAIGRDIQPEHIQEISKVLDSWSVYHVLVTKHTCCLCTHISDWLL